jgi:endonuclease YncB( thermonuclease family)
MVEQVDAGHPGQMNIENQAGIRLWSSALEEFLRGPKSVRLKLGRSQQPSYGAAQARVVLDESDRMLV